VKAGHAPRNEGIEKKTVGKGPGEASKGPRSKAGKETRVFARQPSRKGRGVEHANFKRDEKEKEYVRKELTPKSKEQRRSPEASAKKNPPGAPKLSRLEDKEKKKNCWSRRPENRVPKCEQTAGTKSRQKPERHDPFGNQKRDCSITKRKTRGERVR